MKINIKVEVVETGSGAYVALFRGIISGEDVDLEKLPEVSLSRVHGKCYFRLDKMHEHDHHAPPWTDQVLMQTYIERVFNEIREKCVEAGLALNDEVQTVKVPNIFKGNPHLN